MAKVKIQGHASGTGVLTVTAPNTDTDRTITLPDSTGTLATTADTTDLDGAITINESGADVDFRVESDTNANSLFVQGSNGAVGLGVSSIGTNDALHIENGESYLVMKDAQQMGIKLYGDDTNVIFSYDKTANSITGGVTWAHADGATDFYTGGLNSRMKIDATGAVTMPNQPAFLVNAGSNTPIALSTDTKVNYSTEVFDQNSDFDTSTQTFTAPVTGKYQFNVQLLWLNWDSGANYYYVQIATSNRTYYELYKGGERSNDVQYSYGHIHVLADMDASDTAFVRITQVGGSVQTYYDSQSIFSGHLVC